MTRLITQQERRLTAAEFQQLAEVLVDIEWFANFEIRADGFRPKADSDPDIKLSAFLLKAQLKLYLKASEVHAINFDGKKPKATHTRIRRKTWASRYG